MQDPFKTNLPPVKSDQSVLEEAVPAHMLYLTCEALITEGWQLRGDTLSFINNGTAIPFKDVEPWRTERLARKVDEIARAVLRDVHLDSQQHYVLTVAYLILYLVEEGAWKDRTHVMVIVSLGLIDEARDHEDWLFDEKVLKFNAKKLFTLMRLQSLYLGRHVIA